MGVLVSSNRCLASARSSGAIWILGEFIIPSKNKAPENPRRRLRISGVGPTSPLCRDICHGKQRDHRQRADEQYITHIVARHALAGLGRALHNVIVFDARHSLSLRRLPSMPLPTTPATTVRSAVLG